ncbi:hypothetical protein FA95DRAFT_1559205 [Auriscalpium vulgare]|uniref:Uncharacterized protein n=1 Tax=Auriscalpium vulgare TaxID=40419 RepID=A0ACB8RUB6_9AGAM|nr:hypothetical protein FA95DRAFT_1559205 [Auriscalpium vulgare]
MPFPEHPEYFFEVVWDEKGVSRRTERAWAASSCQYFSQVEAMDPKKPMDQLTSEFNPKVNRAATTLQYGILITEEAIVDFTVAHKLLTPADLEDREDPDEPLDYVTCAIPFIRYMRKETGAYLYLRPAYSLVDDLQVITLYDNYSMEEEVYEDAEEKRVIEIVQKITGIKERPRWYHDYSCVYH